MRRLPQLFLAMFFLGLLLVGIVGVFKFSGSLARSGEFDSIVLDFRDSPEAVAQVEAAAQQFGLELSPNSQFSGEDHVFVAKGDSTVLDRFRRSELSQLTEFIEPNYIYSTQWGGPNDPDYAKQWNMKSIDAEGAWATSKGRGITVAVIDTGVTRVKDLSDTPFVPGYDFVNDKENADDDNGHGTHVAGTIAQSTNNRYGVAGVAYEAKIMPLKVLSAQGGGTVADIAEAIRFAADHGANVINMSLGGGGASKLMEEAIDYAYGRGVTIIAAAGNAGSNAAAYPARYAHVMGVSATDVESNKAFYSNYGAGVDISAPGGSMTPGSEDESGGILQETINRRSGETAFMYLQGTSMAAPHVAGVAALVEAAGVKQPDKVWEVLQKSARKVSGDDRNYFGAGRLDAAAAVKLARKGTWPFGLPNVNPLNSRIWYNWQAIPWKNIAIRWSAAMGFTWLLSKAANHYRWNRAYWFGAIVGSVGLFLLPPLYLFDLPHWPMRLLGSSLPELGNVVTHTAPLHPVTASALIPFLMLCFLLGHPHLRWVTIGAAVGVTAMLGVSIFMQPQLLWLGAGWGAQLFLAVNAALSLLLAYLGLKTITEAT